MILNLPPFPDINTSVINHQNLEYAFQDPEIMDPFSFYAGEFVDVPVISYQLTEWLPLFDYGHGLPRWYADSVSLLVEVVWGEVPKIGERAK